MPPAIDNRLRDLVASMQYSHITFREAVTFFKREWVQQTLEANRGNNCRAARAIGLHRNTLSRLADSLDINVREIRRRRRGALRLKKIKFVELEA